MRLEIQEQLERVSGITCTGSAEQVAATCEQAVDAATHVIVILTDTRLPDDAPWLESGSLAEQQLVHALRPAADGGKRSREIVTIYDKPKGLDGTVFGLEGVASDAIKHALWGHEALVFRGKATSPAYERTSMINEIVRQMCSKKASTDHLIADTPPPLLPAAAVMPAVAAPLAVDPLAAFKAAVTASADPRVTAQGLFDLGVVSASQHAEIVREIAASGGGEAASK
jgi:hypothetical protein